MNSKMIMIPEERYWKMIESYDKAMDTIEELKKALAEATNNNKSNPEECTKRMMALGA